MIDAYAIGVRIALQGGLGKIIQQLIEQFGQLDKAIGSSRSSLKGMSDSMRAIAADGKSAAAAWQSAAKAMEAAARAGAAAVKVSGGMAGAAPLGAAMRASPPPAQTVPLSYGRNGGALTIRPENLPVPYRSPLSDFSLQGGPYSPYGTFKTSPYRGPGSEVVPYAGGPGTGFTMGVGSGPQSTFTPPPGWNAGSLVPGAAGTGGGAGGPPAPINLLPGGYPGRGPSQSDMMITAMGAQVIARGIFGFLQKAFTADAAVGAELARLGTMQGYDQETLSKASELATKIQQSVGGTTIAGNLHALADITSVFQSPKEAMAILPDLARMGIVLGASGKGNQLNEIFAAARAGELRGSLSNPDTNELDIPKFAEFLHQLQNVTVLTGGRIGPMDYVKFLQMSGVGGVRLSDESLFSEFPAIMMAMSSIKAGTAVSSFNQTEFGRLAKPYGEEQERLGIIAKGGFDAPKGFGGGGTVKRGALQGRDMAQEDPARWAYETLLPAMEQHDIKTMNDQLTELYRVFPRSTITRLFEDIIRNRALLRNYKTAIDKGNDPNSPTSHAFETQENTNPQLRLQAYNAAMNGFFVALGESAMGPATAALRDATGALNGLGDWAKAHPTLAKTTIETAAALGALSYALGGLATSLLVVMAMLRVGKGLLGMTGLGGVGGAAGGAVVAAGLGGGVLGMVGRGLGKLLLPLGVGTLLWDMNPLGLNDITPGQALQKLWPFGSHPANAATPEHPGAPNGIPGTGPAFGPQRQSFAPPGTGSGPPTGPSGVQDVRVVNGRDLVHSVGAGIADHLNGPPTGMTGHDPTIDPNNAYLGWAPG